MEVNIHHAKTNLSQLILKAESGEEVIIARAGKPVVRLVPVEPEPKRKIYKPGILKDKLWIAPDAFDPKLDEEIASWFNDGPIFPKETSASPKKKTRRTVRTNGARKR